MLKDTDQRATFALMTSECLLGPGDRYKGGPGLWKSFMGLFYADVQLDLRPNILSAPSTKLATTELEKILAGAEQGLRNIPNSCHKGPTTVPVTLQVSYLPLVDFVLVVSVVKGEIER